MGRDFWEKSCRWIVSTHFFFDFPSRVVRDVQTTQNKEKNNKMSTYHDEDFDEDPQYKDQRVFDDEEYINYMVRQHIDQLSDYMEGK